MLHAIMPPVSSGPRGGGGPPDTFHPHATYIHLLDCGVLRREAEGCGVTGDCGRLDGAGGGGVGSSWRPPGSCPLGLSIPCVMTSTGLRGHAG